jgi:hypothetical protein
MLGFSKLAKYDHAENVVYNNANYEPDDISVSMLQVSNDGKTDVKYQIIYKDFNTKNFQEILASYSNVVFIDSDSIIKIYYQYDKLNNNIINNFLINDDIINKKLILQMPKKYLKNIDDYTEFN